jgi:ribonuclease-3
MSKKYPLKNLFKNKDLYKLALTHKSWVNENKGKRESNERIEFLGDAVLEFIVSKELFTRFPTKSEGYLTTLRASLVNTVNLSEVAEKLDLGAKLYLSKGEEESGGRKNSSILANTIEAVIGALYLDSGIEACEKFIDENLLTTITKKIAKPLKDAKSRLQEYVQAKGLPAPKYKVVKEKGPDHNKRFTIEVLVNQKAWGRGAGKNKAEAAQAAARKALSKNKGEI